MEWQLAWLRPQLVENKPHFSYRLPFLGVAWHLFLAGGGTVALLLKEDGRGIWFSRENQKTKI